MTYRTIWYKGRKIRLNLAYNRVLSCFKVMEDESIDELGRIEICLDLLARRARRFPPAEKVELYIQIAQQHINLAKRVSLAGSSERLFDFCHDFDLIFASFASAYNINLIEQQDRLSWWEFFALFEGLPEHTKMREVMSIRGRKPPTPNGSNQDEIDQIRSLKQYWSLPAKKGEDNYQDQAEKMFGVLKSLAGRG